MILPLMILALIAFLQTSVLALDLLLVFLIVRAFLIDSETNYYLAFGLGLLVSLLTASPLGLMSIIYVLVVKIVHTLRSSTLSQYWFGALPIGIGILVLVYLLNGAIFSQSQNWSGLFWQGILILPTYIILSFWEERYIGRHHIKLKI